MTCLLVCVDSAIGCMGGYIYIYIYLFICLYVHRYTRQGIERRLNILLCFGIRVYGFLVIDRRANSLKHPSHREYIILF